MKIVAIIQARMNSSRLPGKVLRRLGNETVLARIARSALRAESLDDVVVATSTDKKDDPVIAECERNIFTSFRGSEIDVLSRFYHAAVTVEADTIVRITADCPLFDGLLLETMIKRFISLNEQVPCVDYLSNTQRRTYPRGLDIEIFSMAALKTAFEMASEGYEREHVTPFFYQLAGRFRLYSFEGEQDNSKYRWTLDTAEDWMFMETLHTTLELECGAGPWSTSAILSLLEKHPEISSINSSVKQKTI
ncbi:MAG: glycosyltransferase family protein [Verrucomicrobiota bacterium]